MAAACSTMSSRPSASPANIATPRSRQASRSTACPSSIERQPDTWKPPMVTAIPAARNGRAMSRARWILIGLNADQRDHAEIIVSPKAGLRKAGTFRRARVRLVVSTSMSIATSRSGEPAARRNRPQSAYTAASEFARTHRSPPTNDVSSFRRNATVFIRMSWKRRAAGAGITQHFVGSFLCAVIAQSRLAGTQTPPASRVKPLFAQKLLRRGFLACSDQRRGDFGHEARHFVLDLIVCLESDIGSRESLRQSRRPRPSSRSR